MSFYYSFFPPLKECFQNEISPGWIGMTVVVLMIVHVFIVQFLWNTVLVSTISGVKPLKSFLYTFGLLLLITMLFS